MNIVSASILWNSELGFSNWLHQNISVVAEITGLRLISRQREARVGRLSADILAEIEGTQERVIIENQVFAANHGHLGQIITYAAHFDAAALIWIATSFRQEYRVAIAWLNSITGRRVYAVELQAEEQGPKFTLVAGPKDAFVRPTSAPLYTPTHEIAAIEAASAGTYVEAPYAAVSTPEELNRAVSPGQLALNSLFETIAQLLAESHEFPNLRRPTNDRNYYAFARGPAHKSEWSIVFNDIGIRLELVFNDKLTALGDLERVQGYAPALEAEIGYRITFDAVPGRQKQKIILQRLLSYDERERDPDAIARWCCDTIVRMARAINALPMFLA